jgi:hypothetical protein
MRTPRVLLAIMTVFLGATAPSQGETQATSGVAEGTFAGIEQGDYAHFLLKDKKGTEHSYFILKPDKSVQSYMDNPELKGRRVRVYWREQTQKIPEAGETRRIKVVTKVEARVK